MSWDGKERRSGRDRRCKERRNATQISITLILSGAANRRTGKDRRAHGRRLEDQLKASPPVDRLIKPVIKPYRIF